MVTRPVNLDGMNSCNVFERVYKAIAIYSGFDNIVEFARYIKSCAPTNIIKLFKNFYDECEPNVRNFSIFNQKNRIQKKETKFLML